MSVITSFSRNNYSQIGSGNHIPTIWRDHDSLGKGHPSFCRLINCFQHTSRDTGSSPNALFVVVRVVICRAIMNPVTFVLQLARSKSHCRLPYLQDRIDSKYIRRVAPFALGGAEKVFAVLALRLHCLHCLLQTWVLSIFAVA
jgi:hypothetical protein